MKYQILLASVLGFIAAGCSIDRTYDCAQDSECMRSTSRGACLAPGFCAFSDSTCGESGVRWDTTAPEELRNTCVVGTGGETNLCGGETQLTGVPNAACGVCNSGMFVCDGAEALRCDGEFTLERSITTEGDVSASSIFSGSYPASLATDADLTTSWFSAGPEPGGNPSVFSWTNTQDRCIQTITYSGNEFHETNQFRTNFGFEQMTVEVRDSSDNIVFSKVESVNGTPDPGITIEVGGVMGRSIHLLLSGHESTDCGGFSELAVNSLQ